MNNTLKPETLAKLFLVIVAAVFVGNLLTHVAVANHVYLFGLVESVLLWIVGGVLRFVYGIGNAAPAVKSILAIAGITILIGIIITVISKFRDRRWALRELEEGEKNNPDMYSD